MTPDVISVRHVASTVLELMFADETVRHVDIATLAGPHGVFADLHKPGFVASAYVNPDTGTIEWPSGADLSPEALYQSGTLIRAGGVSAA